MTKLTNQQEYFLINCISDLLDYNVQKRSELRELKTTIVQHFAKGYSVKGITSELNQVTLNEYLLGFGESLYTRLNKKDTNQVKVDILKHKKNDLTERLVYKNNTTSISGFDSIVSYLETEAIRQFYKDMFLGLSVVFGRLLGNL